MEFSVRPIRACLLQGAVSMGNRPRGGGADGEGGGGYGSPLPCLLRLWLTVFIDYPHLPSPLSPQCRLAKNRMMLL